MSKHAIATVKERLNCNILPSSKAAAAYVAEEIAKLIRARAAEGKNAVLGLATGSTPTGIYA